MVVSVWLTYALCALLQTVVVPLLNSDVLTFSEKMQLSRTRKTEERIKIYQAASMRIEQALNAGIANSDFSKVPDNLKQWTELLSGSLEDIEVNLKSQKKSKALISYEIVVRKAITSLRGYKAKAPVDQQDDFDSYLAQAEKTRKRFVEVIFR